MSCATVREHLRACSLWRGWTLSISTFCPHSVVMCFVWISEQTAIISVHSFNWLVFITETEYLLRGKNWVYIIRIDLLYRRLVAVLTPRRPGCNFRPFLLKFVVDRVALVQVSLRVLRVSPCQYHSTIAPYSFIYMLLFSQGKKGEAWEPSRNQCSFENRRALAGNCFHHSVFEGLGERVTMT